MSNYASEKSRLSYSHISTFEKCPLQYKFRYIDKIYVPPTKQLSFGRAIHSAVEEFQKLIIEGAINLYSDNLESILESLLEKNWQSEGYENFDEERFWKQKGKKALVNYFLPWLKSQSELEYEIIGIEDWFEIDFDSCILVGKIDRIDFKVSDEAVYYRIVDFKTSEKIPLRMQNSEDTQLYIYTFGAENILRKKLAQTGIEFNDIVLEKIMYIYLIPNNEVENSLDISHRSFMERTIRSQIDKLLNAISENLYPARTGKHCDWCDFKNICEAYKSIFFFSSVSESKEDVLRKKIEEWEELYRKMIEKEKEIYDTMKELGIESFTHNNKVFRIDSENFQ